jgi:hypothetical protein
MSNEKQSHDLPDGELLPPREVMSLIDPTAAGGSGLPGTSGLLGGTDPSQGAAADPTHAAGAPDATQAATPAHGIGDNALQQAQTTPGTSSPHVESSSTT